MPSWRKTPYRPWLVAAALVLATVLAFSGAFGWMVGPLGRPLGAAAALLRQGVASLVEWQNSGEKAPWAGRDAAFEALLSENAKLKALVAENEALKAALGYVPPAGNAAVTASVVSETDSDVLHGLVIDRGFSDGISVGQPVVVGNGLLIGKIFETRRHSSTVMLLTDSHSRLAVSIQNGQDTLGVLEGDRGLAMSVKLVPQTEALSEGDTIITSGLEKFVPRGLIVGAVSKVERGDRDPFQSAVVEPFGRAGHPTFVQVLSGADFE